MTLKLFLSICVVAAGILLLLVINYRPRRGIPDASDRIQAKKVDTPSGFINALAFVIIAYGVVWLLVEL